MMKWSYRALLSGAGVALFIVAMDPSAVAAKPKIKSSRCGGYHGECNDICKRNFNLDQYRTPNCHRCSSCPSCERNSEKC